MFALISLLGVLRLDDCWGPRAKGTITIVRSELPLLVGTQPTHGPGAQDRGRFSSITSRGREADFIASAAGHDFVFDDRIFMRQPA
jgi:hypothetical protein